ncbi:Spo0B domain-containing protein [Paenibacillus sp. NPDC056579]|uniref:Spo0B domain-containing protein n=1 Tax=Paenibacillus sp. NPDC056579 TaxID=3345871 RepID=UPI00369E0808
MTSKRPDNGRQVENTLNAQVRDTEQNERFIRLLNHYRHDWMNEIQVLFGYVKLKKYDKLEDLMEKIKDKIQRESYLAKLGVPELVIYLLAFQAEVKEIALRISMEQEIRVNELSVDTNRLLGLVADIMEACKENARLFPYAEHALNVSFAQEADRLVLGFEYSGEMESARWSSLIGRLRQKQETDEVWEHVESDHNQSAIRVALLLNT